MPAPERPENPLRTPSSGGTSPVPALPAEAMRGHIPDADGEQLRTMYDLGPIPAYVWQRHGDDFVLRGFNRAGAEMVYGFCHRFLGRTAGEMYADIPEIRENLARCFETGERVQHELVYPFRSDPALKLDLLATYAFVPPDMVTVFTLDISQRLDAEREARQSRERYRRLYDNALVGLGRSLIGDGRILEANHELARIFGYPSAEALLAARPTVPYADPHERARVLALLREHGVVVGREAQYHRLDGRTIWARTALRMFPDEGYIEAVVLDVTAWKEAEAQKELLATAIEVASESIVITDIAGVIEYANPAFATVTGWEPAAVVGQREEDLLDSGRSPVGYTVIREQLQRGVSWRGRLVNKRRDGTLIEEDASFNPVLDGDGRPTRYVSVKRDVTNEVRLERQLEQARRMEAIGRLAGGIAHDFNNLLTAILGHTELGLARVSPEHQLHEDLLAVRDAGERAARLTRQLLEFSRPQPVRPRPVDLNELLRGMEKMLRTIAGTRIRLQLELADEPAVILADAGQIERVVMNLFGNAVDAMPEVGTATIATTRQRLAQGLVGTHADLPPGEYVRLRVRDEGVGMPPGIVEQMFEPFFTTKPPGEGTGLGLATVHGIVGQIGGGVAVTSQPGSGTTVDVWIPVTAAMPAAGGAPDPALPRHAGTERVLVVEDDGAVRRLVSVALREAGYRLEAVPDAESALELVATGERFDLLLTDLRLPGIGGHVLATELRRLLPQLPVICVSGYTDDQFPPDGPGDGMTFLAKPFTPHVMLQHVRRTLDSGGRLE